MIFFPLRIKDLGSFATLKLVKFVYTRKLTPHPSGEGRGGAENLYLIHKG